MELLTTGIKKLDRAIGGGFLEDSIMLIIYDTYSFGWSLGVKILENRIAKGDFGVIINTVLPLSPLAMEIKSTGFDVYEEGKKGDLGIIGIFESFNQLEYGLPYVYIARDMDISTYLPKYSQLYRRMLNELIGDRRPVGVSITMDGLAFLLGERNVIKVTQRLLALKETARITETRKRPLNILLLNKDRVSKRFTSWLALYSQYIIDFQSSESSDIEKMIVRKSPLPNFESRVYRFRLKGGDIEIS